MFSFLAQHEELGLLQPWAVRCQLTSGYLLGWNRVNFIAIFPTAGTELGFAFSIRILITH